MAEQQTPKQEFKDIMLNIFDLIFNIVEKYPVESQEYKQICDLFKKADLKFDNIVNLSNHLQNNTYYNRYVRQEFNSTRQILTDEQKLKDKDYKLCECGCFIKKYHYKEHLETQKHYVNLRSKKHAIKQKNQTKIDNGIKTEILIGGMLLKRQQQNQE